MAQVVIFCVVAAVLGAITFLLYRKRKNERPDLQYVDKMSMDKLFTILKQEMAEMVRDDNTILASDENYEAIMRTTRKAEVALTDCVYGILNAKIVVLGLIRDVVEREIKTLEDADLVVKFSNLDGLNPQAKWEILVYRLKKKFRANKNLGYEQLDVIYYLDAKYNISDNRKPMGEDDPYPMRREFDYKLLDFIFHTEVANEPITYSEALDIISIMLYTRFKGFGCVDTLRYLKIDGFHFGTSGSIRYELDGKYDAPYRSVNSVWVQWNAKWIHFSFLDFFQVGEMRRVVNQLVSYGMDAPMTEKKVYKVTDMEDGARATAIRPGSGETWACFIRKFTLTIYTIKQLLGVKGVKNWRLVERLLYYLMKSERTLAFTGQQNTGKTTDMKAAIEYVDNVNIRVLEMSFELALREIYPTRDIMTVKPSAFASASNLQDLLKKTDGYLSMVGEVAEDIVAARMIQFCLIGSAFTMFSHHAKDDFGLINGLANSLVASGEYGDHNVALSTVLDAIKHNWHKEFFNGIRIVAYISEIEKLDEIAPYPEVFGLDNVAAALVQLTNIQKEYYTRSTDRVRFKSRKVIVFNKETMTYETNEWYSPNTFRLIMNNLSKEDRIGFSKFYEDYWILKKDIDQVEEKERLASETRLTIC